eukprot:CAMPEP_0180174586 /NCGR_PEP_ID=MMETSP0986-20121125/36239_1 /TAXON_ID=697907 /ORGANISM="non described non described, Strain CCMP2293" /LENGTH=316 /DNA_ID=CAMNT_0022126953 /DNA_START=100 /DNA_END=1050 /DNA_ORIENTATION=-
MATIQARKPKNRAAKKAMQLREPKLVELGRSSLFMRGTSTSESITEILKDLHDLKKPDSRYFPRRNDKRPFEDETSVEFLCMKNEASVFGFGSHSKKRPNYLVLGRLFNYKVYDMHEFSLTNIRPANAFKPTKFPAMMNRPVLIFQGEAFETDPKFQEVKSLFLDMFSHAAQGKINLAGVEHSIVLTASGDTVAFRHYRIGLKKSGGRVPRADLEELGPRFDFKIDRQRLPSLDLKKTAMKIPKQLTASSKLRKNTEKNALGDTIGRVHMEKQQMDDLQTRKMTGLKRGRDKVVEADRVEQEEKKARLALEEAGEQ